MQTVIIAIGHGPNSKGQYPPINYSSRLANVIVASGYDIVARIDGESSSNWGTEDATWFSVVGINAESVAYTTRLDLLKSNVQSIRRWAGQDAIGIVVNGEYNEI